MEPVMTTADLATRLKNLALLKNDGATQEIRDDAVRDYDALKAQLAKELEMMKSPAYWRK